MASTIDRTVPATNAPLASAEIRNNFNAAANDVETLEGHVNSTSNPHGVTAAQAGADPAGTASSAVSAHNGSASAHPGQLPTTAQKAAMDAANSPSGSNAFATVNDLGGGGGGIQKGSPFTIGRVMEVQSDVGDGVARNAQKGGADIASSTLVTAGADFTDGALVAATTADRGLMTAQKSGADISALTVVTAGADIVNGNLAMGTAADRGLQDSGIVAARVVQGPVTGTPPAVQAIETLTEAEYTALPTKDPNTLYVTV